MTCFNPYFFAVSTAVYIFTENDNYIYIHINSCGGFIKDLLNNLDLFDNSVKLISIIENNISMIANQFWPSR